MDESSPKSPDTSFGSMYSPEKDETLRNVLRNILTTLTDAGTKSRNWDKISDFQSEIVTRVANLRSKYSNAENYTAFHTLMLSGVRPNSNNVNKDFPGDDSVEKFIDYLAEKYK